MPRRPVYTEVMDVLKRRVAVGEYMLRDLPGERRIAEELGVSYMTARKAVLGLIDNRVLARAPNGTLVVHPDALDQHGRCRVALLTPAYPSSHFVRLRHAVALAAQRQDIQLRAVEYVHWDDSVVREAFEGTDGIIVIPSTEPLPERVARRFTTSAAKVVAFDGDLTEHGVPSIRLFADEHIVALFEHLKSLGHRRVDCLNTQGYNEEIERRIRLWREWTKANRIEGTLFDDPAPAYSDPLARAHRRMHDILEANHVLGAIVATTQPAAIGAIRACYDVSVAVGTDVSICAINNEPTGRYFCPSLTGLEMPDIDATLDTCFEWFLSSDQTWPHGLSLEPSVPKLLKGESTGAARVHAAT
jgi:DNA-binding LacI/PurR family transcriptional regulator